MKNTIAFQNDPSCFVPESMLLLLPSQIIILHTESELLKVVEGKANSMREAPEL